MKGIIRRTEGLTIIELVVVMCIMDVMVLIAIPNIGRWAETKRDFDSHTYSRHRITDVNYKSLPPPGWELTMFEKRYSRINSIGVGPASASKEIEVLASYVFPKE